MSLEGHLLPGVILITISTWWLVSIFKLYFKNSKAYSSTTCFLSDSYPNKPLESYAKLGGSIVGIVGEAITAFDDNWVLTYYANGQHISMFFFFGLQAALEIMKHRNIQLIPDLEYFGLLLAFGVELVLLSFHIHGPRHMMAMFTLVHNLIITLVAACCASVALEMAYRSNVLIAVIRAYFTLVQGTWFCHAGFILSPPPGMKEWNPADHNQMTIITVLFTWHLAIDFVAVFLIGVAVLYAQKRRLGISHSA